MSSAELSRYNGILSGVYATDNAYRVLVYGLALLKIYAPSVFESRPGSLEWTNDFVARMSDARVLNRFFMGLSSSLESLASFSSSQMSLESQLGRIMALSMVFYHPLEHGWFLTTLKNGGKVFPELDGNLWSLWSCRCWMIYVVCDLIGTCRSLQRLEETAEQTRTTRETTVFRRTRRNLYLYLTCILSDLPLALQWSIVGGGPFTEKQLAFVGFYGGVASLYGRWIKATDAARDQEKRD